MADVLLVLVASVLRLCCLANANFVYCGLSYSSICLCVFLYIKLHLIFIW